jgi:hypothetical protein
MLFPRSAVDGHMSDAREQRQMYGRERCSALEETSDPNDPDREMFENGSLLPPSHAVLAGPTFEKWLASQQA